MKGEKMKKLKKCIVSILLLFALIFTMELPTFADAGSIQRYSSGGSSSSSHSSSRHSSSSSSGGGVYIFGGSLPGILIVLGIYLLIRYLKKKGGIDGINNIIPNTNDNTSSVEAQIRNIDPMFSAENFMSFSKEVFIKLQAAWTDRKWEEIRPFESNELFEQHSKQLQQYIDTKRINIVDRVSVRKTYLNSFTQDGDKETLKMTLKAVMKDYIINEETKEVLEGNPNQDMYMVYTLTFIRKAGVKTVEGTDKKSTTNCPNCGAPTNITSSGKCEYCGSIITTGEHDWVLSNLEGHPGM